MTLETIYRSSDEVRHWKLYSGYARNCIKIIWSETPADIFMRNYIRVILRETIVARLCILKQVNCAKDIVKWTRTWPMMYIVRTLRHLAALKENQRHEARNQTRSWVLEDPQNVSSSLWIKLLQIFSEDTTPDVWLQDKLDDLWQITLFIFV